jgi:hypothetical protein
MEYLDQNSYLVEAELNYLYTRILLQQCQLIGCKRLSGGKDSAGWYLIFRKI